MFEYQINAFDYRDLKVVPMGSIYRVSLYGVRGPLAVGPLPKVSLNRLAQYPKNAAICPLFGVTIQTNDYFLQKKKCT